MHSVLSLALKASWNPDSAVPSGTRARRGDELATGKEKAYHKDTWTAVDERRLRRHSYRAIVPDTLSSGVYASVRRRRCAQRLA